MVETIGKIRQKISKLLQRVHQLEQDLETAQQQQQENDIAHGLQLVEFLDAWEEQLSKSASETERAFLSSQIKQIHTFLSQKEITPLSAPLDQLDDFIKIVGKRKDNQLKNGQVAEVVKKGYLIGENLLRPTHVIIIDNEA